MFSFFLFGKYWTCLYFLRSAIHLLRKMFLLGDRFPFFQTLVLIQGNMKVSKDVLNDLSSLILADVGDIGSLKH
jgi:hypothetical protein